MKPTDGSGKTVRPGVNVESGSAEMVAVQVANIINGRPVATLVDYHLIKFIGIDGAYSLEEEKLQQRLPDEKYDDKVTSEDGGKMYALFPGQLLLDHCSFIAASLQLNPANLKSE